MRPLHFLRYATLPLLVLLLLSCNKGPALFLHSPIHGMFLNGTSVLVEGGLRTPGASPTWGPPELARSRR